jgi:hypothetical protein
MKITVYKEGKWWRAACDGMTGIGDTPEEAIGSLVKMYKEDFNIEIEYKEEK